MPTPLPVPFRVGIVPILLVLALLAGCTSDDVSPKPARRDGSRPAPLPTVAGQQTFFEGRIIADVKVGAMTGFKPGPQGAAAGAGRGDGPPGRRREGFGAGMGGVMGGMGGPPPGGGGGPPPGGKGGPGGFEGGPPPGGMPRGMPSSPPVMIHLRLTNTGTEKVEVVIADFLSPLGNFVTFPDRLTLEPGQSAEVDPMTSGLAGQVTGGEITLRLKLGDRQETKTVTLQPETPAAPPAPGPAT